MPKESIVKVWNPAQLPPNWFDRTSQDGESVIGEIEKSTKKIVQRVVDNGDKALIELTLKFDKAVFSPETLRINRLEIEKAYDSVSEEQVSALKFIKKRLSALEKPLLKQRKLRTQVQGVRITSKICPIESVGCYVPGGLAVYPSTLIMMVVPAKVAGVPRVVVCSPPNGKGAINPLILVAADICGVDEIYRVGGAQAIAAMAYGTRTIKPVRKIVGPGNRYVTMAKTLVSKDVAIDMPAGPSEILLLADENANPALIARDMISQAEHGKDSISGLITASKSLATAVLNCLEEFVPSVERKEIVESALRKYGFIIECENVEEMINLANTFAPEHIEIMMDNAREIAGKITSAGLILIGVYSPVPLSDYGAGTNHVLPTAGFGHVFSGLSVFDFTRRVNMVESSKLGLENLKNHVKVLAEVENLPNHYKAVEARFDDE
jgi:histidinol dehydrogenase